MAATFSFQAAVYGTAGFNGGTYAAVRYMGFPSQSCVFIPAKAGETGAAGAVINAYIQVGPAGLNQQPVLYMTDRSVAQLIVLANA